MGEIQWEEDLWPLCGCGNNIIIYHRTWRRVTEELRFLVKRKRNGVNSLVFPQSWNWAIHVSIHKVKLRLIRSIKNSFRGWLSGRGRSEKEVARGRGGKWRRRSLWISYKLNPLRNTLLQLIALSRARDKELFTHHFAEFLPHFSPVLYVVWLPATDLTGAKRERGK